jgi:ribonuclease P protein component
MQTEHLEARASASLLLHPRVGIVVPKYRHNVVSRNRIKRRLRELARIRLLPQLGCVDLLLRARPPAYATTFEQLASDVDTIARWVPTVMPRS